MAIGSACERRLARGARLVRPARDAVLRDVWARGCLLERERLPWVERPAAFVPLLRLSGAVRDCALLGFAPRVRAAGLRRRSFSPSALAARERLDEAVLLLLACAPPRPFAAPRVELPLDFVAPVPELRPPRPVRPFVERAAISTS